MQGHFRRRHDAGPPPDARPHTLAAPVPDSGHSLPKAIPSAVNPPGRSRPHAWALRLILGFGIFHLVYASFVGLAGDEAYYWQWSRQLDWGYYDHPPMAAYLIALGTHLAGHNEFGVRFVMVLLSTILLWLVYRMTVDLVALLPVAGSADRPHPATAGLWAIGSLSVTPLFGVGGFLATPDIPLVFFWTLTIALTLRAVRDPTHWNWVLVGLALGLGMISKYSMVILPMALFLVFTVTHHGRRLFKTPGPWIATGIAMLVCTPHSLWQLRHDFVSVFFQLGHGLGAPGNTGQRIVNPDTFGHFLVGQAGVVSPILFLLFIWVLLIAAVLLVRWYGRRSAHGVAAEMTLWLLLLPAALTLAVFAAASFFAKPQANWPVAAYPTLSVLLGVLLADWAGRRGVKKLLVWSATGFAALITVYAHVEAAFPVVSYDNSVFNKLQEKKGLANWLAAMRAESAEARSAAVLAENYRLASLLAFYLPDHPRTDAPFERGSGAQYTIWRDLGSSGSQGMAWYLTRFENDNRVLSLFRDYRLAGVYVERRAGVAIGNTYAYFGRLKTISELAR